MRGGLTDKIQELAKEYLGREITQKELRLYPFIDYCIKNGGYMDRQKLDSEELDILHSYKKAICTGIADTFGYHEHFTIICKKFYGNLTLS